MVFVSLSFLVDELMYCAAILFEYNRSTLQVRFKYLSSFWARMGFPFFSAVLYWVLNAYFVFLVSPTPHSSTLFYAYLRTRFTGSAPRRLPAPMINPQQLSRTRQLSPSNVDPVVRNRVPLNKFDGTPPFPGPAISEICISKDPLPIVVRKGYYFYSAKNTYQEDGKKPVEVQIREQLM